MLIVSYVRPYVLVLVLITSKSLLALILRVLASFVNSIPQSWPATQSCRRHEPPMATVRTETTRGPTYSMTRAIEATPWRKGSSVDASVCIATIAHSQWKSFVTWTDLSNNGHIDELVSESATSV